MTRFIEEELYSAPHFKPIGYDKRGVHFVVLPIQGTQQRPEAWRSTFQKRRGEPDLYWSHMTLFQVDCESGRVRPVERTERHGTEVIYSKIEKGQRRDWHRVKPATPLGNLWKMTCEGSEAENR